MIYTRCYAPVKINSVHVKREASRRGDTFDQYYLTAELIGPYPDGSGKAGDLVHQGKLFVAAELNADGGWSEIMDEVERVSAIQTAAVNFVNAESERRLHA